MQPQQRPTLNADEMRQVIAENRSFTSSAVVVFFLYWLFWIPGLIFNIMYLSEARKNEQLTGRAPSGLGCLWALLVVNIIPLGGCCLFLFIPFMQGLLGQ